jgi:hypothetical protein
MSVFYTPMEADHLKAQRQEREPGVELVRCDDGIWRTEDERVMWDRAAQAQERVVAGGL